MHNLIHSYATQAFDQTHSRFFALEENRIKLMNGIDQYHII